MALIGVQRWSLNHRMRVCVTPWSSAVFLGNGFIPLMRLDIYDHMLSMILISGAFAGHRRTSIAALARNPSLILTWRQLYLPMHDYQCVAYHEAWGYDQYISVQLGLRNVNEVQFAVIADTFPCGMCHCEGDLRLQWAWRHVDLRCHILPFVESRCTLKWLEFSFLFWWGQLHPNVVVFFYGTF